MVRCIGQGGLYISMNTLQETLQFFATLTGELLLLFLLVSFAVAMLQEYLPATVIQRALTGRGLLGNAVGAGLGALTPFCSCSTIPVTVGLLNAGAPFGATMSFLLASPIMNPVIIGLVITLFGWQVAVFYGVACLLLAIVLGAVWELLGLQRYVKNVRLAGGDAPDAPQDLKSRLHRAWHATVPLFKSSIPYLLVGAAVGALIYGVVPEAWIATVGGPDNPFAIPLSAAIGVPLYIRAETLIPIGLSLHTHGMSLGAVMALIIGGAGASIPEVSLLNSIFRPRLVVAFVITVFGVAITAGYLANALFT